MHNPTFYGYDGRLNVTRSEYVEIRATVGANNTPMVEVICADGTRRSTVFLPAGTAEALAAAIVQARRDAEQDAGLGEPVAPHRGALRA